MKKLLLLILAGIFSIYNSNGQTVSYSVIPAPQMVNTAGQESFHLKENTTIVYPKGDELLKAPATVPIRKKEKPTIQLYWHWTLL